MPKPGMHTGNETDSELNFAMSAKALPLFNAVKKFIAEEVEPMAAKFYALGENREDRWQYVPGQLELLEGVKSKAKAQGLWNFFLPNAETGEGLSNLDYAYIAVELGKSPLASECLNCSAPDTGNMEVLERVGTPEQKEKDRKKRPAEFGTAEDFMLTQAAAYLKGQPIKKSKSRLE